jgi:hypothetical protein
MKKVANIIIGPKTARTDLELERELEFFHIVYVPAGASPPPETKFK